MTIQIKKIYSEIYSEINIKSVPYLIILFSLFVILFGYTNITITAATKLSYPLLVIILTINQLLLLNNQTHYKIYIILSSILLSFALVYIIHIKRIYDEEMEIIIQLKDKDIIEDTIITC